MQKNQASMSNLEAAAINTLLAHQERETETTICMGSPKWNNTRQDWRSIVGLLSLNVCCHIWMVRLGSGIEIHEGPILTSINGLGWLWWCSRGGAIFLTHPFVPTVHRLNCTAWVLWMTTFTPLWTQCTHSVIKVPCHKSQISFSSMTEVYCTQIVSTVTRSQSNLWVVVDQESCFVDMQPSNLQTVWW